MVCTKEIPGRQSSSDITLFEAVGIAIEDIAAASFIYEKAKKTDMGKIIHL
jgi:ornithine cyclodeaminase